MRYLTAIGLFCDDIREEKGERDSLIGVLPDNVEVPSFPGMFQQIWLYGRIQCEVNAVPVPIKMELRAPDRTMAVGDVSADTVKVAVENALKHSSRSVGFIMKARIGNFHLSKPTRLDLVIIAGDDEFYAGQLNIKQKA